MVTCDTYGPFSGLSSAPARPSFCARSIVISSRTRRIAAVSEAIIGSLELYGHCPQDILAIRIALEEALVNAIKHGNANDPNKKVRIAYVIATDSAWIRIEDEGTGFVVEQVPDPRLPENLDRPSGRGILLMRAFMDSIEFEGRGNIVILQKTPSK